MSNNSPLVVDFPTNEEIYVKIGHKVARDLFESTGEKQFTIGVLSCNYYSFTFSMDINTSKGHKHIFVKIPKAHMRGTSPKILPITTEDRVLAKDEETSLRFLSDKWDGIKQEVSWVKIYGIVPEYNAIVTKQVFATDVINIFRRIDKKRRFGLKKDLSRLESIMKRLGGSIGHFHQANSKTSIFKLSDELQKIKYYCQELCSVTGSIWPERIMQKLQSMKDMEIETTKLPTFKGIDIRNVLIDYNDSLFILDPGKTKLAFREIDLARLISTYQLLHWGSFWLILLRKPHSYAESVFMNAYCEEGQDVSHRLLNLYLLKEYLKHWHNIIDYVEKTKWPRIIKKLVLLIYVNPFFSYLLKDEWSNLFKYNNFNKM